MRLIPTMFIVAICVFYFSSDGKTQTNFQSLYDYNSSHSEILRSEQEKLLFGSIISTSDSEYASFNTSFGKPKRIYVDWDQLNKINWNHPCLSEIEVVFIVLNEPANGGYDLTALNALISLKTIYLSSSYIPCDKALSPGCEFKYFNDLFTNIGDNYTFLFNAEPNN